MKMKKLVGLLLTGVMSMSLVACGSGSTETAEPDATTAAEATTSEETATETVSTTAGDINATVIWRAFDDQFQSGFRIIMGQQEAALGGITLDMQDAENDVSKAINKLDTSLTKGTDILAICAPDRESTATMAEKADTEGVPIVFFNMEPTEDTMTKYTDAYYVGAEASESGAMCAQALINYWDANKNFADKNGDGKLQICILQGETGQQDVVLRTQAYEDTLKTAGIDYEILACDTANWDQSQALDKMNTWITAYGIDGIEGVLSNNDSMAMGAVQACVNNGYNQGDAEKFVPIVGIDANIDALEAMKDGSLLGTVLNDRKSQSIAIINVMKAIKNGKDITEETVGVDCTIDGHYIWVPYVIVDDSNLDDTMTLMQSIAQ
ncbi:MAG: galactose ABC transporter substrate-binding protein [Lachnospiraceae bacterium]|nr:galactose ABC transporter substrate-binding protein [Lachnospiraceae bacterium]